MAASRTGNYIQDKGYNAAAAITAYRAVKFSALETVTPVTGDTDVVAGIAQHGVTTGEIAKGKGASIRVEGDSLVEAAAAINPGVLVTINASGQATSAVSGDRVIGTCVEGAGGAGEYCRVHLNISGGIAP